MTLRLLLALALIISGFYGEALAQEPTPTPSWSPPETPTPTPDSLAWRREATVGDLMITASIIFLSIPLWLSTYVLIKEMWRRRWRS
ncbi:hypothetical protein [Thermoflexus sp.]|uniref:hypothetical protein n=1 Tax=Thermoflexus sp. TaxID=1969742 RepID=UPI002ADE2AC1|nr:hypothetical protein [Thermoflexus sp.]